MDTEWITPPKAYQPYVRWWWFGGGLTKAEIDRELYGMREAHIGGVEIQPIYSALKGSPLSKEKEVLWLSEQWLDLVKHTVETAKQLGIQVDLTFGNGWPFGGPYITEELASTKIQSFSMPLDGGELAEIPLEDLCDEINQLIAVVAVQQGDSKPYQPVNLTEKITNASICWEVPPGKWDLYWFSMIPTGQKVKRATPGGEGLVLDHFNHLALDLHAEKIGTALKSVFGSSLKNTFGAFFCDSWEVYGADWTAGFKQKFVDQMRYDIVPYMPIIFNPNLGLVLEKMTEEEKAVFYDYFKVRGEIILQEFFAPFTSLCHQFGVKSRVQPYSAPVDLLKAYGLLDILEIEGFGRDGIKTLYYGSVDPRLASSGAHMYGKDLVSCESFTWIGEHFAVSLEKLKQEADQIILHGINKIIYHGYPYSPVEAGVPGWVFYASVCANHNNTWFPYMHLLNTYIARNSYLSQQGDAVVDFAVYIPYHDEWSGRKDTLKNLRTALKLNGHLSDYDYINDERLLTAASVQEGDLAIGSRHYKALIFIDVEYLPLEVAKKIEILINQNLLVYFIQRLPAKVPGFKALSNDEAAQVKKIFTASTAENQQNNVVFLKSITELPVDMLNRGNYPDFEELSLENREQSKAKLEYIHYRTPETDYYFIVNGSEPKENANLRFRIEYNPYIEIWNPLNGEKSFAGRFEKPHDVVLLTLSFAPFESKWVVFQKNPPEVPLPQYSQVSTPKMTQTLDIKWNIRFYSPANNFPTEPEFFLEKSNVNLFDWSKDSDTQFFSGTATYESEFIITQDQFQEHPQIYIDLGEAHEIAFIRINNQEIGILWQGKRISEITKALHEGKNTITIHVTNLLLNRIIGYDRKGLNWKPDYYFVNRDYKNFDAKQFDLLPSGLIGPIQLVFY